MHPTVYRVFEDICSREEIRGAVLEVGAVPGDDSLLRGQLFAEGPPEDDPGWTPYPGPTAGRADAISRAVRELWRPDA
jgi:hypothetical protein